MKVLTTDFKTSILLSKELDNAGYKFEPYFRHSCITPNEEHVYSFDEWDSQMFSGFESCAPAFTMCQLWSMIPAFVRNDQHAVFEKTLTHDQDGIHDCDFKFGESYFCETTICNYNPCNAIAQLALYCIKNNIKLNLPTKTTENEKIKIH